MSCVHGGLFPPPGMSSYFWIMVSEMKNFNINKKQNKQISDLQLKVAQLKRVAAMPKKARRRVNKQSRIGKASHPLMPQIKALVNPFAVPSGVAQHLIDAVPSVKYTLKGRATVTIPSTAGMTLFVAPTMADSAIDTVNRPSAVALVSTGGSQYVNPLLESSQVGTDWRPTGATGSLITPNRPYYVTTNTIDSWRLVSYGVRVRYTGTALNANGTIKALAAPHGEFQATDPVSLQTLVNELESSMQTAYKSVYNNAVYEFSYIGDDEWRERTDGSAGFSCAIQGKQFGDFRLGQATSPYFFSEPGAFIYYVNNSTSSVQMEIELIEHWEIKATNLQPFYTTSHTEPALHHEIMNIVNTAHAQHGVASNVKTFAAVVGDVSRASKSPLGKAVLAAALA